MLETTIIGLCIIGLLIIGGCCVILAMAMTAIILVAAFKFCISIMSDV